MQSAKCVALSDGGVSGVRERLLRRLKRKGRRAATKRHLKRKDATRQNRNQKAFKRKDAKTLAPFQDSRQRLPRKARRSQRTESVGGDFRQRRGFQRFGGERKEGTTANERQWTLIEECRSGVFSAIGAANLQIVVFSRGFLAGQNGGYSTLEEIATNELCPLRLCDLCVFKSRGRTATKRHLNAKTQRRKGRKGQKAWAVTFANVEDFNVLVATGKRGQPRMDPARRGRNQRACIFSAIPISENAKLQNAKCKVQNAKCKMQNAKCKM